MDKLNYSPASQKIINNLNKILKMEVPPSVQLRQEAFDGLLESIAEYNDFLMKQALSDEDEDESDVTTSEQYENIETGLLEDINYHSDLVTQFLGFVPDPT